MPLMTERPTVDDPVSDTDRMLNYLCIGMEYIITTLEKFKPLLDKLDKRQKRGW